MRHDTHGPLASRLVLLIACALPGCAMDGGRDVYPHSSMLDEYEYDDEYDDEYDEEDESEYDEDGSDTPQPPIPEPPVPPEIGPANPAFFTALDFGPANEGCHIVGTRVSPEDDWWNLVDGASAGDIILFEAGIYAETKALIVPSGVSLFAYDCEEVSIVVDRSTVYEGTGAVMHLGDDIVIAGLIMEGVDTEVIVRFDDDHDDIVLRNNTLLGGQSDAIRFKDTGSSNILFEGNVINSGPAQPDGITGSSGGHVIYFDGDSRPTNVIFRRNKIQGDYFGDVLAGDGVVAIEGGQSLVFEENWFDRHYNIESFWDIKTTTTAGESGAVTARRNWFTNGCMGTKGGKGGNPKGTGVALVFGDSISDAELLPTHVFEDNRIEIGIDRCSTYFSIGGSGDTKLHMEHNVFISDNDDPPDGEPMRNVHDVMIAHNTFYRGAIATLADSSGFLVAAGAGLAIEDNLFYRGTIHDLSDDDPDNVHEVHHNLMVDMISALEGGLMSDNLLDEDPQFIGAMEPERDLRLQPGSPAEGAASDGTNIGAY